MKTIRTKTSATARATEETHPVARRYRLLNGETTGCETTHLHRVWHHMLDSARNPNDRSYLGKRGVDPKRTVYPPWSDYTNFMRWAVTDGGYAEGYALSRKNLAKGFYPSNCAFVQPTHQNGRCKLHHVEAWGGDFTGVEIATRLGMSKQNLHHMLKRGIPLADIISGTYAKRRSAQYRGGKTLRKQVERMKLRHENPAARLCAQHPVPWRVDKHAHSIVDRNGVRVADIYHGSIEYGVAQSICTAIGRYCIAEMEVAS